LFLVIEELVVGVVEDERLVFLQVLVRECDGVVGDIYSEVVFCAELLERCDAGGDVVVDIKVVALLVFGIDQDARFRRGSQDRLDPAGQAKGEKKSDYALQKCLRFLCYLRFNCIAKFILPIAAVCPPRAWS